MNASTIATTAILLQSTSEMFPNGLGNNQGVVGKYLMDHHFRVGAQGSYSGLEDKYYKGRRPNGIYIPRFRNLTDKDMRKDYVRGFGFQGNSARANWEEKGLNAGFGQEFKNQLLVPGDWNMWLSSWGETLPYAENRVGLSPDKKDQWGLPLVEIDFKFRENEKKMREDMRQSAVDMLEEAGFNHIESFDYHPPGGTCVHEMGTTRMGRDPKESVLNEWNQMHEVKNIFITDGSCMTSSGCQNPSLTYMALTARACDYAFNELKKGNL